MRTLVENSLEHCPYCGTGKLVSREVYYCDLCNREQGRDEIFLEVKRIWTKEESPVHLCAKCTGLNVFTVTDCANRRRNTTG